MKKFETLTEKEVLKLTSEQLKKYYEYRMAEKGVPFMDKPIDPEYEEKTSPDLVLYTSNALNSLYFTDSKVIEDINIIIENHREKLRKTNYDYNSNTKDYFEIKKINQDYTDSPISFKVKSETVYSESNYISIADINKRNSERLKANEELWAKYNENEEARNECSAYIYDEYYKVEKKHRDLNEHKTRFRRYVELANGNLTTAIKFYKDAYSITEDIEKELKNVQ